MAKLKLPNALDLLERADALCDRDRDRDRLYQRLDDLYDQSAPTQAAEDENAQIVRMNYGTNAIDLITDLATQQTRTVEVPAAKDTKRAKQDADDQEAWLRAWTELNERKQKTNFNGDMAWLGAQRACIIARTMYNSEAIKRNLTKDDNGDPAFSSLPVVLQIRDPKFVHWNDSVDGIQYLCERWPRPAHEINHLYPGVLDADTDDDQEVEWTEVWTPTAVAYFADREPVKIGKTVRAHGFGCVPYAIGTARTTPRPGVKRWRPLLASVESLLNDIDVWYSILATAGWSSVTNAWAVFSDSYGQGGKDLHVGPNDVNYFAQNDRIQSVQRGTMPADFFRLGDMLMAALQQGTFPFAMYGQMPGQMAGYAINMLTQSGRRPLAPIWSAIGACYADAYRNTVTILREKVAPVIDSKDIPLIVLTRGGEEVGRRGLVKRALRLDTSLIGDDWDVHVELGDPMPQDEAANIRLAIEATRSGLLSPETALAKFKIVPDPMDELDRVTAWQVYQQLAPQEGMKIAVERGLLPDPKRMKAIQDAQQVNAQADLPPDLGQEMGEQLPQAMPQPDMAGMLPPQGMPPMQPGMPQPDLVGAAEAGVDPAMMQALAGMQQAVPDLNDLAGAPPNLPISGRGITG